MSRPPTADDLLSFKEFEPIGDAYSSTGHGAGGGHSSQHRAEININSPTRSAKPATLGSSSAFDEHFNIDDMSTSVNMMDDQTRTSAGRTMPASTSAATSLNVDDDSEGGEKPTATNYSFFTIEYYQQFFDVDTQIVMERILNAMVPRRASGSYLRQNIAKNPDLYGPFWIVVTLIFCIAISGNVASYMQHASTDYHWRYNFHLVSTAATTIVLYVCLMPLGLWAAFRWFVRPSDPDVENDVSALRADAYGTDDSSDSAFTDTAKLQAPYLPGLLTLMCIYGYSLGIYVPVSILWVIQISVLQWLLVLSAALLSGSVLVLVLTPALRVSRGSLVFAAGIVAAHFVLAAGFMLYFFHVPEAASASAVVSNVVVDATAAVAKLNATTG